MGKRTLTRQGSEHHGHPASAGVFIRRGKPQFHQGCRGAVHLADGRQPADQAARAGARLCAVCARQARREPDAGGRGVLPAVQAAHDPLQRRRGAGQENRARQRDGSAHRLRRGLRAVDHRFADPQISPPAPGGGDRVSARQQPEPARWSGRGAAGHGRAFRLRRGTRQGARQPRHALGPVHGHDQRFAPAGGKTDDPSARTQGYADRAQPRTGQPALGGADRGHVCQHGPAGQ